VKNLLQEAAEQYKKSPPQRSRFTAMVANIAMFDDLSQDKLAIGEEDADDEKEDATTV
jgi:hypothetical protein